MIQIFMNLVRRMRRDRIRKTVGVVLFFIALFAYATTGFMYFEIEAKPDLSWTDAAWWSIVTMTTVGYGDYFPESTLGRLFVGLPTMLLGVSMLGYLLSMLATVILESKMKELRGDATMTFSGHVIIVHFNSLDAVQQLIDELRHDALTADAPIVLIDEHLEELPDRMREDNVFFVRGNPARETTLDQAAFRDCRYLMVQADAVDLENSDTRNLTVAITIERLCPEVRTVVHCVNPENAIFFERAGVDSVVCPSALSTQLMVQELQDPGLHAVLQELTSNLQGKQLYVVDPPTSAKTVADLHQHYQSGGAVVLGVRHGDENELLPAQSRVLTANDRAIVLAAGRPAS